MKRTRRGWFSFLADWTIRLGGRRPDAEDFEARRRRIDHPATTARWKLRMSEFLRDRLRPRWLRKR